MHECIHLTYIHTHTYIYIHIYYIYIHIYIYKTNTIIRLQYHTFVEIVPCTLKQMQDIMNIKNIKKSNKIKVHQNVEKTKKCQLNNITT